MLHNNLFVPSTTNNDSVNEWQTQYDDSGSADVRSRSVPPDFRVWEPVGKKSDSSGGMLECLKI